MPYAYIDDIGIPNGRKSDAMRFKSKKSASRIRDNYYITYNVVKVN